MLVTLLQKLKSNTISQRLFIAIVKRDNELQEIVNTQTNFLDEYDVDILERLYYVINDLHNIVKCKYCNNKAIFTGRLNEGYKEICNCKECRKKQLSEKHTGNTKISSNRDNKFIAWLNNISEINDDIIKKYIKYDKHVSLLTNSVIINYLKNRFNDSESLLETVQRIKYGIEEKPKCPICGKPVTWVGKNIKMYTTFCSPKCAGSSEKTIQKKKETLLKHWGTLNCYDSDKFKNEHKKLYNVEYTFQRADVKEKRKETFTEKYGTTNIHKIPEFREKEILTNIKNYGESHPMKNKEYCKLHFLKLKESGKINTSKFEQHVLKQLLDICSKYNYTLEYLYLSSLYDNYICDFYINEIKLFIECLGSLYHHYHPYDPNNKEDIEELHRLLNADIEYCKNRNLKLDTINQYKNIIKRWTNLDVKKRILAETNNLHYLELFKQISDIELENLIVYFGTVTNDNSYIHKVII